MGMMRTYRTLDGSTVSTKEAKYFVNLEVEKTQQHLQKTLFVVGIDRPEEIINIAKAQECNHVYFGTGTSFLPSDDDTAKEWDDVIVAVLDAGLWATLDFDSDLLDVVCAMKANGHSRFIPMISVKADGWERINSNATVKFDDIDFNESNSGVWCVDLESMLTDDYKTAWSEYTEDTLIKTKKETIDLDPEKRDWYYDGHGHRRLRTTSNIRDEDS